MTDTSKATARKNKRELWLNEMPSIESCRIVYHQKADSCAPDGDQYLTVEVHDAGGGAYITVRSKRFAIDNPRELIEMLSPAQLLIEKFSPLE